MPNLARRNAMNCVITRSIVVAGHKVSFTLDEPVWNALKEIVQHDHRTLCKLVAEIDIKGRGGNLSSAIRAYVCEFVRANEASRLSGPDGHHSAPSMWRLAVEDAQ